MENSIAGRGRRYRRIVIDEAAFAKDGDNRSDGSVMAIWEKAIKPTLYDYGGEALVCSNSAGKNPDNFFYNICTDPRFGFHEYHATTLDNPLLPKRFRTKASTSGRHVGPSSRPILSGTMIPWFTLRNILLNSWIGPAWRSLVETSF